MFRFNNFVLDLPRGCLRTLDGGEVELRRKSFEVMRCLVMSGGRLVTKDELLKTVWPDVVVGDESLTQCVSEVRRALRDEDQDMIKTVPRRGYRFVADVVELEPRGAFSRDAAPPPTAARPSIAVLPFANLSGDPLQDYFSDGVTEDIITELSRFSELLVIARNSTFQYKGRAVDIRRVGQELAARYVLEGSVRRDGDRVRVGAQLVDALTGGHLWAERYERRLSDVFTVQDELAHAIAAILAVHVSKAEAERVLLQPPSSWRAYEFYLRAAEAFRARGRTRTAVDEAGRLVREALSVDPQFARAHALLSKVEWWNYVEPCNQHYLQAETLGRARELATKAVQLAPHLPEAHAQLGWTLLFERRHDDGVAEFERAFALNCNFVDNRLALALVYAGRPQDAIDVLGARIELDPFQPFDSFGFLGHAQSMLGQDEKAVRTLAVYPSRAPAVRILPLWLAAAYARIGDLEHAHAEARQVLRLEPEFTIHRWGRTAVYRREEDAERLFGGLRMAGLA